MRRKDLALTDFDAIMDVIPRPCPDGLQDITAVYKVTAENLAGKRSL